MHKNISSKIDNEQSYHSQHTAYIMWALWKQKRKKYKCKETNAKTIIFQ
jgi:hypothetical protein